VNNQRQIGTLKGLAETAIAVRSNLLNNKPCPHDLGTFGRFLYYMNVVGGVRSDASTEEAFREEAIQLHTLVRWVEAGLPAFDLTHGLMAALLLTDPSDVDADLVRLPFSTFAVRLPDGFWSMYGISGELVRASIALVHSYVATTSKSPDVPVPILCFRILSHDGQTSTWEVRPPIPTEGRVGGWLDDDVPPVSDSSGTVVPPDAHDGRLCVAFRRLLVNLALYVAEYGRGQPLGRRPEHKAGQPHTSQPGPDVWVLGREVKLDRELVNSARAWTDSKSPRPGARAGWRLREKFTVRGHWRNVPHGPGRGLRKLRFIAPYWKGEGPSFAHVYKMEDE